MKKVRILSLVLVLVMCLSISTAFASAIEIAPFWTNVSTATCTLSISGTTATCYGKVTCESGTTKINGTLTLYKKVGSSWVYVDSWDGSSTTATLTTSGSKTVTSGYDYKCIYSVDAYRNGSWETVEKESSVKSCG